MQTASLLRVDLGAQDPNTRGGIFDVVRMILETVTAPTNIACIKYWGKESKLFNTPVNSSVSVTLDQKDLRSITTVAASKSFKADRLW